MIWTPENIRLHSLSYREFQLPKTQKDWYESQHADPEIVRDFVSLTSSSYSTHINKFTADIFNFTPPLSTEYDHIYSDTVRIRQKNVRYTAVGKPWRWQHIVLEHNWDVLLLTLLEPHQLKFYMMTKNDLHKLISDRYVKIQGSECVTNQGYWFTRESLTRKHIDYNSYMTQITNNVDVAHFMLEHCDEMCDINRMSDNRDREDLNA